MIGRIVAAIGLAIVTLMLVQSAGNVTIAILMWRFDVRVDAMIAVSWLIGTITGAFFMSLRRSKKYSQERTG